MPTTAPTTWRACVHPQKATCPCHSARTSSCRCGSVEQVIIRFFSSGIFMSLPPYRLFRVNTERVQLVTPHMKRITIDGSCLPAFRAGLPAQWLKVFVPTGDEQNVPGRAYTVRRFDPVSKKLDLDFVLHGGNGPVSAW